VTKSRKLTASSKAEAVVNPGNPWARRPQQTRNGRKLVMSHAPELLHDDAGEVVGVEVRVRLYDVDGVELAIDPVRRFVNPPLVHEGVEDPTAALWSILWDSVEVAPNPGDWVPSWQ
jgi:hypothetical protein